MSKDTEQSIAYSLISVLKKVIFGFILLILSIVVGFLAYIGNISASDYQNVDATGVYNLVDSEGNVIATDLTPEDIEKITELLNNGKD